MDRLRLPPLLVILALVAPGCGDGGDDQHADGTVNPGNHVLEILDPPGRSIGLEPTGTVMLRVRYLAPDGSPAGDAEVGFALEGNGGGATLAGFSGFTTDQGIVEMPLTAGNGEAAFNVVVSAAHALPVSFEVAVSAAGFTVLELQPSYGGVRQGISFGEVRGEVYFGSRCIEVDPLDGIAPSRQRSAATFGEIFTFPSLPVNLDYAVAVRGLNADGALRAWVCVDIHADQLLRGVTSRLSLSARDWIASPEGRYAALSRVRLGDGLRREMAALIAPVAELGRCPFGPTGPLLDCIQDLAFPDDAADCNPTGDGPGAEGLEAARGLLDAEWCRTSETTGGDPSLEWQLFEALDATGLGYTMALAQVAAIGPADHDPVQIRSEVTIAPTADPDRFLVWHRLQQILFPRLAPDRWLDLGQLGSMLLETSSLQASLSPGIPDTMTIPPHAMGLHTGYSTFAAVHAEHLGPAGLPRDPAGMMAALLGAFRLPSEGMEGCAVLDRLLCQAMGEPDGCLGQACQEGSTLLADTLESALDALPGAGTPDVMFAGALPLMDADEDGQVEHLGDPDAPVSWLMTMWAEQQWWAPAEASVSATRISP